MPRIRDEEQVRTASEACLRVFVSTGSPHASVAELAHAAGISERKFYRWFATKEQSVRPALEAGARQFTDLIDRSDLPLPEAAKDAFADVIWNDNRERSRALFPVVFRDPVTWAVFLHTIDDSQLHLVEVVAKKTERDARSMGVRITGAAISSAVRFALQDFVNTGDDPCPIFASVIDTYREGAFDGGGPRPTR